jgi:hypothetical protein
MSFPPYKPIKQKSRRQYDLSCDKCKQQFPRAKLFVRRVQFVQLGMNGKVMRSRTTDWLCESCMGEHPDYNRTAHRDSPGNQHSEPAGGAS